jgi:hypothetical protein
MKKTTTKTPQRKLVLRRENVASLTLPELRNVAGGSDEPGGDGGCSNWRPRSCNPPPNEGF